MILIIILKPDSRVNLKQDPSNGSGGSTHVDPNKMKKNQSNFVLTKKKIIEYFTCILSRVNWINLYFLLNQVGSKNTDWNKFSFLKRDCFKKFVYS